MLLKCMNTRSLRIPVSHIHIYIYIYNQNSIIFDCLEWISSCDCTPCVQCANSEVIASRWNSTMSARATGTEISLAKRIPCMYRTRLVFFFFPHRVFRACSTRIRSNDCVRKIEKITATPASSERRSNNNDNATRSAMCDNTFCCAYPCSIKNRRRRGTRK